MFDCINPPGYQEEREQMTWLNVMVTIKVKTSIILSAILTITRSV
jgi:hypothetical protein